MGHTDPRMTLRVYTDVTGKRPQTRTAGLLDERSWTSENAQQRNIHSETIRQRDTG